MQVYLDNAATTPIANEVFESMKPYLTNQFGNPSSLHSFGRHARAAVESARKSIAQCLGVAPAEIVFTSGGTEANNTFIQSISKAYGQLITTKTEHHAVLEVAEALEKKGVKVIYLDVDREGNPDYDQLELSLKKMPSAVSIMYVNNETGVILDTERVARLCGENQSYFHTDGVQAVGHLPLNLSDSGIHGLSASSHKFHGPKGTGFMFIKSNHRISPMILGGPQERELRAGTENVAGIVGTARALELASDQLTEDINYVNTLKDQCVSLLKAGVSDVSFNGSADNGIYSILNVSLPPSPKNEMMLFKLDLKGVAVSGGSACSSGASQVSHVLREMKSDIDRGALRFSFSRYNTPDEIAYAVNALTETLSD